MQLRDCDARTETQWIKYVTYKLSCKFLSIYTPYLCPIIIIHHKRHDFITRMTSKHEMVWCWYQKRSVPSLGSFIKLMELPCTGSWMGLTAGQSHHTGPLANCYLVVLILRVSDAPLRCCQCLWPSIPPYSSALLSLCTTIYIVQWDKPMVDPISSHWNIGDPIKSVAIFV